MRQDFPIKSPTRIGVVVHVFYADLLDEIVQQLAAIPVTFDLIITNASGEAIDVDRDRLPRASTVVVLDVENHGRDILPLAHVVNAGLLDPYHVVLKIHTKRSEWRDGHADLAGTGAAWRTDLLRGLLGDAANVASILSGFAASPGLGLVTADGSLLGPEFWGDNQAATASLLRRLELDLRPAELKFAAGSMYWIRGFVLQGLRALNLCETDFEPEAGQVNATTAHALERLIGVVTAEAGLQLVERSRLPDSAIDAGLDWFGSAVRVNPRVRVIPFYLPQFHPIPENDRWWGAGFTEWANVAAARPVYLGHDQPKLPADLGFYDIRLPGVVARQVSLAEGAGIDGFMYYHYWFAGKQLLERPILDRVAGDIKMPFCLMWANENWTRRWDGRESDVIMGQRYDEVPTSRFIEDVLPILRDPRYMCIDGRAVLAIYRPAQIPDLPSVIESWRQIARSDGVGELFVMLVDVVKEFHGVGEDPATIGLDGTLGFPPHNALWDWIPRQQVGAVSSFTGNLLSYRALVEDAIRKLEEGLPEHHFPGVMVAFDNTARRQSNPDIWVGSNPYTFRRWLAAAASAVANREPDRRVVFVNAWNEWSEGAVLEPSARFGSTYLLAVRDVTFG
jgi:lipopolysaccharide biosynthesis protein